MAHSIVVRCPSCSQKYRLSPDKIGAKARCKCGQRFTVASDKPLDEDTVFGWVVQGADPGARSVMGGTAIVDSPIQSDSNNTPDRSSVPQPSAKRKPRVELDLIDELGAHFQFPARRLNEGRLRNSFPKQCVGCGRSHKLNVHLIVWNKKLPADDPLRIRDISHQPVGRLRSSAYADAAWLEELPKLRTLPKPFNAPFPFFVCSECAVEVDVVSSLIMIGDVEYCQICIANLKIGVGFFRNNGGTDTPEYERLLAEYQRQKKDRWRALPANVRRKISQWYDIGKQEEFRGFFPDADFSRAEMGKAGVVITSKHLSCHRYSTSREFSLANEGRIHLHPDATSTTLRIVQRGRKDATVHLDPALAEKLLRELQHSGRQWSFSGRAQ